MKIAITSARKGQGQTILSINLAAFLSQMNQEKVQEKILIVDLNRRFSDIKDYIGTPEISKSLDDFVMLCRTHQLNPESIVECTHKIGRNIFFISPNECNELNEREIEIFLQHAEKKFSHIIIDTISGMNQAISELWSQKADGIIRVLTQSKMIVQKMVENKQVMQSQEKTIYVINQYRQKIKYGKRDILKTIERYTPFHMDGTNFKNQYVFKLQYDEDIVNYLNRKTILSYVFTNRAYTEELQMLTFRLLGIQDPEYLIKGEKLI